jgi:hypothetical protein
VSVDEEGDMAFISDPEGNLLTEAEIQLGAASEAVMLVGVGEPGTLLQYYFGRGKREVEVSAGSQRLLGRLETSWRGNGRRWLIRSDQPAASHPSVAPLEATIATEAPALAPVALA